MIFRELDKQVLVADAPMQPQNMAEAAAHGVTLAINNRPDGEAFDQVDAAVLGESARDAGLAYLHLPVETEFTAEKVEALTNRNPPRTRGRPRPRRGPPPRAGCWSSARPGRAPPISGRSPARGKGRCRRRLPPMRRAPATISGP